MDVGEMDLIRRMIDERFGAAPDVSAFEARLQLIEQESMTLRGIVADMQVAQASATSAVTEAAATVEESAAAVVESAEEVVEAAIVEELAEVLDEVIADESVSEAQLEAPPMEPATPQEDTGGRKRWYEKPIPLFGR